MVSGDNGLNGLHAQLPNVDLTKRILKGLGKGLVSGHSMVEILALVGLERQRRAK